MRAPTISLAYLAILTMSSAPSEALPTAPSINKVIQYPLPTWLENIAVRSNGNLLATTLSVTPPNPPELLLIDPSANPPTSKVISAFDGTNVTGLLGIVEIEHDVFAFVGGNISTTGAYAVYKADLNTDPATISKIADVPAGGLLNGMAKLNDDILLITDSMVGNVVNFNIKTGESETVLDDASLKPATVNGSFVKAGANGIKIHGSYVYYTNSALKSLYRVRIDCETGKATGPFEELATDMPDADDLALLRDGTAFVAVGKGNVVEKVRFDGEQSVYAGGLNSSAIPGPTATALGKFAGRDVVFVVTNGAINNKINGTYAEGGSVIAVDLR